MACWSACTYDGAVDGAYQYDATPHVLPPSSERNRSTPAAQTRLASFGSTAMTLLCHPMLLRPSVDREMQLLSIAEKTFVSSSAPYDVGLSSVCTCGVQVVPPSEERNTAKSPWSNVPPLRAARA